MTDGNRIFFEEFSGGNYRIASLPVGGGEIRYLNTPFKIPRLRNIFPDGSGLLVLDQTAGENTWRLPLLGGAAQPLVHPQNLAIAAISPDGHRIAYLEQSESPRALYVGESNGENIKKIFETSSATVGMPAWSPDERRLCFTQSNPAKAGGAGSSALWEIAPDGSQLELLIPEGSPILPARSCRWTRDGKYVLFDAELDGKCDIWALRYRGALFGIFEAKPIRLTDIPIEFITPFPSPKTNQIFALGLRRLGELVRFDREKQAFVPYLQGISAGSVSFSLDGEWVAYVKHPESTLWRSRLDGSEARQLTSAPLFVDSPHWSPDGRQIAFRASRLNQPRKIHLISADGGIPVELMPADPNEQGVPTWSPDSKSLVFGRLRFHPNEIAIERVDVTTRQISTMPGSQGLWTPRWSPDGRFLVALEADAVHASSPSLFIFDFRSQRWEKLLEYEINEPVWSRDSKYIYFDSMVPLKDEAIYRIRIADGNLEKLVDLKRFRRGGGRSFGFWFGLAPDDSPLLLREKLEPEIYSLDIQW
jgi:Tol biopolymer transport system component